MDFEPKRDGGMWPLQIHPGGLKHSFCPAKATWDNEAKRTFELLTVSAETGAMLVEGGISKQPDWWVEMLAWFLPAYDRSRFYQRVRSVIGGGNKKAQPQWQPPSKTS